MKEKEQIMVAMQVTRGKQAKAPVVAGCDCDCALGAHPGCYSIRILSLVAGDDEPFAVRPERRGLGDGVNCGTELASRRVPGRGEVLKTPKIAQHRQNATS